MFGSDPDLKIQEELEPGQVHNKVAIEIKGGTDKSNAHNRAGEAEKSHQKARAQEFNDFWTIIAKKGLNLEKLKSESPTTNRWFDVSQVLAREGEGLGRVPAALGRGGRHSCRLRLFCARREHLGYRRHQRAATMMLERHFSGNF
ncbi:MAG: XcyI family restriction endonuclease [Candidatus Binataceae bacterium]